MTLIERRRQLNSLPPFKIIPKEALLGFPDKTIEDFLRYHILNGWGRNCTQGQRWYVFGCEQCLVVVQEVVTEEQIYASVLGPSGFMQSVEDSVQDRFLMATPCRHALVYLGIGEI